jgi:FHS family L-fucose permease-like MFS transporter
MLTEKKFRFAFVLITSLFFLWGLAHNLNPVLIPHLKRACQLTDLQSAFIDSSFFIGYFVMALPAGAVMKRWGYKAGIIAGLLLFALGAFLFFPAAETRVYGFFLGALFIIASGLTFLETAANPYVTVLGTAEHATQRLNFSQSFNGLAATLAPLLGGLFILSDKSLSAKEVAAMPADKAAVYLTEEAKLVQLPYFVIGLVVLLVALLIWRTKLPEVKEDATVVAESPKNNSLLAQKNLMLGVLAQFFYVGAQVCVSSFFIRFSNHTAAIPEKSAAFYLSAALLAFMIGRFVGTYLMKFVAPHKLLLFYSIMNIGLLAIAINVNGLAAIYCLIGVEFFMSIMFPTIFSLSIFGLGSQTKIGSSLVIMAIAGGAVFPVIMGRVSDVSSIQTAYIVPLLCFFVVGFFALRTTAKQVLTPSIAHA